MISIQELIEKYEKIIVWGAGSAFEKRYNNQFPIAYIVDGCSEKWGKTCCNIPICSPEKVLTEDCESTVILIFSSFSKEIIKQAKQMKIKCPMYLRELILPSSIYEMDDMKMSFAAFAEDAIIEGISKRYSIPVERYIDIGANHPRRGNATFAFYLNGASGCLIEPNEEHYELLRLYRDRDTVIQAGVADEERNDTFQDYYVIQDLNCRNTFSREVVEQYREKGINVETRQYKLLSLNSIIEQYMKNERIDYISIDVEGFEWQALKDFHFEKYDVSFFNIEKGDQRVFDLLKAKNYELFAETISDWIFVKAGLTLEDKGMICR